MLSSVEFPLDKDKDDFNKLTSEQRHVVLPSFKAMMRYVNETSQKRLNKNLTVVIGRTKLPFSLEVYEEVNILKCLKLKFLIKIIIFCLFF